MATPCFGWVLQARRSATTPDLALLVTKRVPVERNRKSCCVPVDIDNADRAPSGAIKLEETVTDDCYSGCSLDSSDPEKIEALPSFTIKFIPGQTNSVVMIGDSGIGMIKDVLVKILG